MFFGCCQNKYRVRRRFFQCFQEGIECRLRKHVNLIDDIDLVFAGLWRYAYLLGEASDIIYRVIRSSIQLMNIERITVAESAAGRTNAAGFIFGTDVLAIDRFSQDSRTGSLSYTTRPAEQKGLGELIIADGVF